MLYPALELLEGGGKLLDWLYDSTRNFVSTHPDIPRIFVS